ncbi:hypothetical protein L596_006174 [Steinernema carpocapsae]|uniref:Uncharacterized protein n=1 Tax=Steinernema carpocapsae TaxID=34508 RepID=A0A4U8V1B6_STECR|nr:hypothetical protein L596_006174 [Steinernema carpocapsae]
MSAVVMELLEPTGHSIFLCNGKSTNMSFEHPSARVVRVGGRRKGEFLKGSADSATPLDIICANRPLRSACERVHMHVCTLRTRIKQD